MTEFSLTPPELEPLDLASFVPAEPDFPEAAKRNRAAITAVLSGENAVNNYQSMVGGVPIEDTKKPIMEQAARGDMQGIISVLSDKNIPIEQKQAAIEAIKKSNILRDPATLLQSRGLEAPSKGENEYAEAARLNIADALEASYRARQTIQGLVNAHTASLNPEASVALPEMAEVALVPFATSAAASNLKKNMAEGPSNFWQTVKTYALPGSAIDNERDKYNGLSPEDKIKYIIKFKEKFANNSGLIFSNENQYSSFSLLNSITGDYSTFDKVLDNLSPVLDLVGLGFTAKAIKGLGKTKAATELPTALPQTAPAGSVVGKAPASEVATLSAPQVSKNGSTIAELEQTKAALLGDTGNLASNGDVRNIKKELSELKAPPTINELAADIRKSKDITNKEAKSLAATQHAELVADYEATKTRLQTMVETNRVASDTTERVAAIEKQIEALKKGDSLVQAELNPISAVIRRVEYNNTVAIENPSTVAKIIQQSNPEQARALHAYIVKSDGDSAATALYGTNKVDALASDIIPQNSVNGRVTTRPFDIERNIRNELSLDPRIAEMLGMRGALELQPAERAALRSNVQRDFESAQGLTLNPAMSSFTLDGDAVKIRGVYGTPEGGWRYAEDAIEQAKFALRQHGIKLEDITLLRKEGLDHVPVKLEEVRGKEGNYLIGIDTRSNISLHDMPTLEIEKLDVKKNWADRFNITHWGNQGSLAKHVMDAASMLHPSITGAAVAVSDLAVKFDKVLIDILETFTSQYNKLDKTSQTKLMQYVQEANHKQIKFDRTDLLMKGWNTAEVDAVASWRKFWDAHYYLENADVVKSLNNQGFQFLQNTFVELYAKAIPPNTTLTNQKFYNTSTDNVIDLTIAEIDNLYANGGTIARLRRPSPIHGYDIEYAVVWNSPTSHLRKVRESDAVLNYRDGYYQLQYDAPKFIDEVLETDKMGHATKTKTVAVAGDKAEAEAFRKRMMQNSGKDYRVRGDNRMFRTGSDEHWDIASAGGRIAQRHRGKLLEDASGLQHLGDGAYIVNPVDSAVIAARSIAGRVVSRPMLENAKYRAMMQYGHMFPSDGRGGKLWPNSVNELKLTGQFTTGELRDARTVVEHINYLENGYTNGMDDAFRYFFNFLGEVAGNYGLTPVERLANKAAASSKGVGSFHKSFVYYASIAWNPIRQLILQPHQAVRTFAYNPRGWANGKIPKFAFGYAYSKSGAAVDKEVKAFVEFLDDSGMMQAVDKQNLVRGTVTDAAGSISKPVRALLKIRDFPRKIGFDLGEMINTAAHSAAVYEEFLRKGANLTDKTVRQEMVSKIRALSYDMNFAGDMPYNQNTASMLMQFLQVPHKAFLQYTNRRLTPWERRRMFLADTLFWGVPGSYLISNMLDKNILPEDEGLRKLVVDGLEATALNNLADWAFDYDVKEIDFSSFAPYDAQGISKMIYSFLTEGPDVAFMNSPAGGLIYKEGSRVREAFRTLGKLTGYSEDIEPGFTTVKDTMNKFLGISSGWANWIKAQAILDTQQEVSKGGRLMGDDIDMVAGWMHVAGFGSKSTKDLFATAEAVNKDVKAHKEEVLSAYRDIVRSYVAASNEPLVDVDQEIRVAQTLWRVFKKDPVAMEIVRQQLSKDLADPNQQLLVTFMKLAKIPRSGDIIDKINMSPLTPEEKEAVKGVMKDFQNATLMDKE